MMVISPFNSVNFKRAIIAVSFLLLIINVSASSENDSTISGTLIGKRKFFKIVVLLNERMKIEDTTDLTDVDCEEIIKVSNSLHYYGLNYWCNGNDKYKKELNLFMNTIHLETRFGRQLESYIFSKGEGTASPGMGIYFSKYNLYIGGRILNNKSFYRHH